MNELNFAFKVRQHLNLGLHELRPETRDRLAAAREKALARQQQVQTRSILATAGNFILFHVDNLRYKQVFSALALIVCFGATAYWTADERITELGVIDSALLTDELPIRAFTDKGFATWLKRASPE